MTTLSNTTGSPNIRKDMSLVTLNPKPSFDRLGFLDKDVLPSAKGTLVYDPSMVSVETAKKIKSDGGVALNGRFMRLLKAYKENLHQTLE